MWIKEYLDSASSATNIYLIEEWRGKLSALWSVNHEGWVEYFDFNWSKNLNQGVRYMIKESLFTVTYGIVGIIIWVKKFQHMSYSKSWPKWNQNQKALLLECKRHTARRVVSTPSVVVTGYPPPSWPGRGGYPARGYPTWVPPHPGLVGTLPGVPYLGTPEQGTPLSWPPPAGPSWVPP